METSSDKQWASQYLLDPLTAPDPSDETGPGTHHTVKSVPNDNPSTSLHPSDPKKSRLVHVRSSSHDDHPPPPIFTNPQRERLPQQAGPTSSNGTTSSARTSTAHQSTVIPTSTSGGRSRTTSLSSRYPGDQSHRPLDAIKRDTKAAHRAPHLRKKHMIGLDTVDSLGDTGAGAYHHAGPFDAASLARNNSSDDTSPIQALTATNNEALKATPREKVLDSLRKHRPLDGVAVVPPGAPDMEGRVYKYEEGSNMMIENGGNYKRWPGLQYHPDDIKGKSEPSYSLEKALKEHKGHSNTKQPPPSSSSALSHRRVFSDPNAIEMTPREPHQARASSGEYARPSAGSGTEEGQSYAEWESGIRRSNTTGRSGAGGGLKKRFGSLRRRRS